MAEYLKPLPTADVDTEPYWNAAKAHELRAQRCSSCHKLRWPPQAFCKHCHSWDFTWDKLSQTGTVVSFVVVHQATVKVFADAVPLPIIKVALDRTDGAVTLTSNIVDCPVEDVAVGLRVQAVFDDVTDEVTLPKFRRM